MGLDGMGSDQVGWDGMGLDGMWMGVAGEGQGKRQQMVKSWQQAHMALT